MRIAKELVGNSDFNLLMAKAKAKDLTDNEATRLKNDLINVLKKVPTFVVIGLPTTFLTLPMLLKILPPNILPET